jgi:predicted metal-dependent TIM-barrel fold hydrolase
MKEYYVGITIYNSYCVTAESEEEAEDIVRDMDDAKLLDNSDFNVNYIDEAPST